MCLYSAGSILPRRVSAACHRVSSKPITAALPAEEALALAPRRGEGGADGDGAEEGGGSERLPDGAALGCGDWGWLAAGALLAARAV